MTAKSHPAADFCVDSWVVRPSLCRIERDDLAVHVTPRAMSVLVYLGAAQGKVVSRNELLDNVWPRMTVTGDALSQCLVELRRAFGDDCRRPRFIETIPRVGLRLIPPTRPIAGGIPVTMAGVVDAQVPRWRPWVVAFGVAAAVIAATLLAS
jgi:DNA-binding winged helix-turn-helix (wHTH) protein